MKNKAISKPKFLTIDYLYKTCLYKHHLFINIQCNINWQIFKKSIHFELDLPIFFVLAGFIVFKCRSFIELGKILQ